MGMPRLYGELADWWPVMSVPEEYAEEAGIFRDVIRSAASRPVRSLLELGSGGGHTASHLHAHFAMTLVDLSPRMLEVSRRLNPGLEHLEGDMRTVRLGRTFDAVMIHDAIAYMITEADLRAAMLTAWEHCRPRGVALFVPDHTLETWRPIVCTGGYDRGPRSLRYLEWNFDPDPTDTWFTAAFAFLLREGDGPVRAEGDQHTLGLFPRATWLRLIREVGFEALAIPFTHSDFTSEEIGHELFLGRRPAASTAAPREDET